MSTKLALDMGDEAARRELWGVLKDIREPVKIVITKQRKGRSLNQNAWYWGVVMPAAAEALTETMGETYTPDRAHAFFKGRFLAEPVVDRRTGEILSTEVRSSSVLDTAEFTEYVEHVRHWLAEYLHVEVPDPVGGLSGRAAA